MTIALSSRGLYTEVMNTLKIMGFGLLIILVLCGGVALFKGSAEYRAQQDAKSITIHVSSTSNAIVSGE